VNFEGISGLVLWQLSLPVMIFVSFLLRASCAEKLTEPPDQDDTGSPNVYYKRRMTCSSKLFSSRPQTLHLQPPDSKLQPPAPTTNSKSFNMSVPSQSICALETTGNRKFLFFVDRNNHIVYYERQSGVAANFIRPSPGVITDENGKKIRTASNFISGITYNAGSQVRSGPFTMPCPLFSHA
jgi:hypothetical protein